MNVEFDATYRDGLLYPSQPLMLPNNTPVHGVVIVRPPTAPAIAPRLTLEEYEALKIGHRFSAPSLPEDFSRADIYSDHD
jgi:hypothetical protein